MNKFMLPALLLCLTSSFSSYVMAADACETALCMFGKLTGNSGGNECHSAERSFFKIVKGTSTVLFPPKRPMPEKLFCLSVNQPIRQ